MSQQEKTICFKIDVDTLEGYLEGVPRLLDLFGQHGIRATFCIATGPDRSGRAVRRIFTRKGFLRKMLRTGAVSMYGLKTMLYGTLLPAPMILRTKPELVTDLLKAGHEVIPHGWDHIDWHDFLLRWDMKQTRSHLQRACDEVAQISGKPAHAFAAPGWQASERSLLVQEEMGLEYSADTRGWMPFWPVIEGRTIKTLQLPTTLPTLDEVAGSPDLSGQDLLEYFLNLFRKLPINVFSGAPQDIACPHLHIYTGHTEVEGRSYCDWFEKLIEKLQADDFKFITMRELTQNLKASGKIPTGFINQSELPGRAGTVTCQWDTVALYRADRLMVD